MPWVLGAVLLGFLLATAWICDDAYISFRSVRNFVEGHGLTYNPLERVQSFTHPLWVMTLIPVYALTGSIYWSAIVLSLFLSLAALFWFGKKVQLNLQGWICLLGLPLLSQAFLDYSSSGLENPLTHFLLALTVAEWLGKKRISILALGVALIMTNRFDAGLLVLPLLAWAFWQNRFWKHAKAVLIGFLPFILWEAFSLWYYGFPFPNTAYAKLNTGLPKSELVVQGFHYFAYTLQADLPTLLVIAGSMGMALFRKIRHLYPIVLGMGLYLIYILWIGGGFMGGRFFAAPFWLGTMVAAIVVHHWSLSTPKPKYILALTLGLPLVVLGYVGVKVGVDALGKAEETAIDLHGVADERSFYGPSTNIMARLSDPSALMFRWSQKGIELKANKTPLSLEYNMGFLGWEAGPEVHLLDHMALTDPLLARLPMIYDPNWRIGHFVRVVPAGYLESAREYSSQIADTNLREYDRRLRWVTRGPLWDWNRFKQIARFNMGLNDYLIDEERYRFPVTQSVRLEDIDEPMESRFSLNDFQGLEIVLPNDTPVDSVRIGAAWGPEYQLLLVKGQGETERVVYHKAFRLTPKKNPDYTISLDAGGARGDRFLIYPLSKLGDLAVALVQLIKS